MPTIAIYPRKSVYTGKGESVQTQIDLCKEYCGLRYESPEYLVYDQDEGYSGGNVNRPDFQRMMADARAHKFDVLCCYRIDRISRNVSDFSRTLEDLQAHHITFVSLKEQFDTSTPMGRAMIYIASVFAQLERDTLAERVRDNVRRLAQDGRWLGGNTPTGYASQRVAFLRGGRQHSYMTLQENPEEMQLVHMLFQRFLELGSLAKLETFCLQNNFKSKFGNDLERMTIRSILSNPVYCVADEAAYAFFSANRFNLCSPQEDFDGVHGILPFNRTRKPSGSHSTPNDISEWMISVGRHTGAIPGDKWVEVQLMLDENKSKARRKPRTHNALLSGLIVCGSCGGYMRPKAYGKPLEDGTRRFSYICELKERSKRARCDMANAPGNELDRIVVERLVDSIREEGAFRRRAAADSLKVKERVEAVQEDMNRLSVAASEAEKRIDNLVSTLSLGGTEATKARIVQQINDLEAEAAKARERLASAQASMAGQDASLDVFGVMQSMISAFASSFEAITQDERRRMLKTIVEKVVWDGKNIEIHIFGKKRIPK